MTPTTRRWATAATTSSTTTSTSISTGSWGEIAAATVTIDARASISLCAFNLDFEGLTIDAISVNDAAAEYTRNGKELTVTPAEPIATGTTFAVTVRYHGTPVAASLARPAPPAPEDLSIGLGGADPDETPVIRGGWFATEGEIFTLGEPTGSRYWYPVNEHPADKATYTARYTVPEPFTVVANGSLVDQVDNGESTTFVWDSRDPIASYLVTFHAGLLETETLDQATGPPIKLSFAPTVPDDQRATFREIPEILAYLESIFGPYPFESIGATVISESTGLALETQTLPIFGSLREGRDTPVAPNLLSSFELTIVHELAHQWFGNSVSIQDWRDIWLSEGFAVYAEALWLEHTQGAEARNRRLQNRFAPGPPLLTGDPGPDQLFSPTAVYGRGALTLHALRVTIGDDAFFAILRTWTERYRHGNATTADFIALAEEVSGQELSTFFEEWLYETTTPPLSLD